MALEQSQVIDSSRFRDERVVQLKELLDKADAEIKAYGDFVTAAEGVPNVVGRLTFANDCRTWGNDLMRQLSTTDNPEVVMVNMVTAKAQLRLALIALYQFRKAYAVAGETGMIPANDTHPY